MVLIPGTTRDLGILMTWPVGRKLWVEGMLLWFFLCN